MDMRPGADQDGDIGPNTLKAVAAMPALSVIKAFTAARIAAYQADAGFAEFGEDWTRRANDCQAAALSMAAWRKSLTKFFVNLNDPAAIRGLFVWGKVTDRRDSGG
jgi:lysozyme family protein